MTLVLSAAAGLATTAMVENTAMPVRLRVGSYNVGHFNDGRTGGFQHEGKALLSGLNRWKRWFGEQALDIVALNEWNRFFDKDGQVDAQKELLSSYYRYINFGSENTWIYNGFATNFKVENIHEKVWAGQYYSLVGEFKLLNRTIHLISTHLPWQENMHDKALQDLIEYLKGLNSFICLGDMNASDQNQLLFTEAGFNIANGGHMGWFVTAGKFTPISTINKTPCKHHIDNIITSPDITIMAVKAPETGLNDLDHLPIIADLLITP